MAHFNPTQAEISLTSQIFAVADPQKLGIITGDAAVNILSGANLSHAVLGEVWAIADKDNNGFLTRKGVGIALRLIGYAQQGETVGEAMLDKPGALASIDGFSSPAAISPPPSNPAPQSSPSPSTFTFPPLSQQDKTKFLKLFIGCGPVNGLLSGEKARDIFVKSKLPYDKLSQIWTLADTKARGALDSSDFTVGMYLIQACMSSPSFTFPLVLPKWIYDQATQSLDHGVGVSSHTTGGSSGLGSPLHTGFYLTRQNTIPGMGKPGSNPVTQITGQYPSPTSGFTISATASLDPMVRNIQPNKSWDISVEDKFSSDTLFVGLDTQNRGFIEGDVAVPFMLNSKLPGDELAQIWDLADLDNDGHLTRDGFAIAMHLIKLRMAGGDIPPILPTTLVPPSRQSHFPATAPDKQMDLLDESPPTSPLQSLPKAEHSHIFPAPTKLSLSPQATGQNGVIRSIQRTSAQPQAMQLTFSNSSGGKDLLGDDDDTRTDILPGNSVEIGNVRNQLSSTNQSLASVKSEKTSAEQTATEQAMQLSQLQTQLALARASYETESHLLKGLRERSAVQRGDIQKTREELITAESELSAAKVEKAEIERSVLKDKEEIRDLQRRMKETISQTEQLKVQMEKLRKDARQQKGLLAIAKKQLATAEAEIVKTNKERDISQSELEILQAERAVADAQVAEQPSFASTSASSIEVASTDRAVSPVQTLLAATIPLPVTPQSTTPRPGSRQSTNPFERLALISSNPDSTFSNTLSPSNGDTTPPIFPDFRLPPPVEPDMNPQPIPESALSTFTVSPSDDETLFLTPPTTANLLDSETNEVRVVASRTTESNGVDNAMGKSGVLLSPLQELEANELDTSDSDDEPLTGGLPFSRKPDRLANDIHGKTSEDQVDSSEQPHSSMAVTSDTKVSSGAVASFNKKSPPVSGKSSPNRTRSPGGAFSIRTLSSHSMNEAMDPFGASNFSTPLEPPADSTPPPIIETVLEPAVNASTISDFDEAFGKLPANANDPASTFKFDSVFDDNFDFASAVSVPPDSVGNIHSATTNLNSATSSTSFPLISAPLTAGETGVAIGPTDANQRKSMDHSNGSLAVTFDDAFGLNSMTPMGTQQLAGEDEPSGASAHIPPPSGVIVNPFPVTQAEPLVKYSVSPQPTTPVERAASPPIRPTSPRQPRVTISTSRTASPPPRASSPRLRVNSKGFSSDNKTEPSKHKLSIRFPFGRKDKSKDKEDKAKDKEDKSKDKEDRRGHSLAQQMPPDMSHFLAPVSESPMSRTVTPAVEDDAEPVKQLAAMGFSRTQSIAALETHGYDVQRALNSLLGAA